MSKQQNAGPSEGSPDAVVGLDRAEIAKFEVLAHEVWDPAGPMRPLHLLNPVRIAYIRAQAQAILGTPDERSLRPLAGLAVADIGCGAGLLSEPMARLGAKVTGVDPSARSIKAARGHAALAELDIAYSTTDIESLAATDVDPGRTFDLVLAMEVIEHTADPDLFICQLADIVRPGGLLVMSTLNKTLRAHLLGIVAAEYLLGWLPRGTHDWRRFIAPATLARLLRRRGFRVMDSTGIAFRPERGDFVESHDRSVNYMLSAVRA